MKSLHSLILLFLALIILGSCQTLPIGVTDNGYALFVSPNGNDNWSGTQFEPTADGEDGPFASIEKARDTLRLLKEQGELNQPATVYIRGGTYELSEPLVFTPQDSGTAENPITYIAYPHETPVISGGRNVEIDAFQRNGDIIQFNVVQVKNQGWVFRQLFVNGERRTRARTPNNGVYTIEGKFSKDKQARATFRNDDIKPEWAKRGDVEFVSPVKWSQARMPIAGVDTTNNVVTLSGQMRSHMLVDNQRYWIENLREAVDAPGEWYLDQNTGDVYYHLMPSESAADLELYAPVHEHVVQLKGDPQNNEFVEHLNFVGLEFQHTAWPMPETGHASEQAAHYIPGAFRADGALSCSVKHCIFKHLGNYGIQFAEGCKNNSIVANTVEDVGAGGIWIGEKTDRTNEARKSMNNRVTDNHISHYGQVFPAAVGVWVGRTSHNTIAHNHIHDGFYTGLSVGWNWGYRENNCHHNTIEYNVVHDIGKRFLSDMGGIYTLGPQEGTVVRHNIFHDIYSYDYGGWGIYPDEGSTGIVYERNIVYNTKSAGFHQHYGKENIIRNNIFAFGTEHQVMRTRNEDHLSFTFENNIVYYDSGDLLGSNFQGDNYIFRNNLYWDLRDGEVMFKDWTWEEWRERGQDKGSKIANPMFVDGQNYDFRLQDDSPAHDLGIGELDLSNAGPRPVKLRMEYPK